MEEQKAQKVCPVEIAGSLDNRIRKWLQKPQKMLQPFISEGMSVLDFGCGPGFFTIEMAKILFKNGKVFAADLQDGMLKIVNKKIKGTVLENTIVLHKCEKDKIGLQEKVDFIWAFYVIHEVPNHDRLFAELSSMLKHNGKLLIIEPKFHVSKKDFETMVDKLKKVDMQLIDTPKVTFSRAILLQKNNNNN